MICRFSNNFCAASAGFARQASELLQTAVSPRRVWECVNPMSARPNLRSCERISQTLKGVSVVGSGHTDPGAHASEAELFSLVTAGAKLGIYGQEDAVQ